MSKTLQQIRDTVRERTDMVGDSFITDAEYNGWINSSIHELYGLLVQKFGNAYYVKDPPYSFTSDGQNDFYALPTDFFKLLGVDLAITGTSTGWIPLGRFEMAERNRFSMPQMQSMYAGAPLRYRIHGAKLWLTPRPQASQSFRVWYVPTMTELASDTDTFDGINGWEEYVIVDTCIKTRAKREEDASAELNAKTGLINRIECEAENRDESRPATVSDVLGSDAWSGVGGYGSPWGL